jgi:hypothetical protein
VRIARTRTLVVLLTLLALPVTAQSQTTKDIPGWSDTRWGMTLDEVRKSHSEMVLAPEYHHWTTDNRGKSVQQLKDELEAMNREGGECRSSADVPTWKLPDLTISDGSFRVCLEFKGERLRRVELIGPETSCYSIAETLTAKYGQPAKQDRGFHLWLMPTTTIRLIDSADMGNTHCKIIYHETEHNDAL